MFLVCLFLNEVYIACCNTQKMNKEAIIPLAVNILYNCGMIFLYYNFSLVISYHSVWLGVELFGSWCRCSRSRAEDVTITDVIIKPPDKK